LAAIRPARKSSRDGSPPREPAFRRGLNEELERLRVFLGLDGA